MSRLKNSLLWVINFRWSDTWSWKRSGFSVISFSLFFIFAGLVLGANKFFSADLNFVEDEWLGALSIPVFLFAFGSIFLDPIFVWWLDRRRRNRGIVVPEPREWWERPKGVELVADTPKSKYRYPNPIFSRVQHSLLVPTLFILGFGLWLLLRIWVADATLILLAVAYFPLVLVFDALLVRYLDRNKNI